MNSLQAKSSCCGACVRRFGSRRRQCGECRRTWTIRPRRRGRPRHRLAPGLLKQVFLESFSLRQLCARRVGVALPAYRYRFRQALRRFLARPGPQRIPSGPLILLADGLWFTFDQQPWVLYLTALKSCAGTHAVFLDPLLLPGREGATRWRQAVAAIPASARRRIQALVVDNLPGMQRIARRHGWALQLCHFHVLLKLQVRRRGVRYVLRGGAARAAIDAGIRDALELPNGRRLQRVLRRLQRLSTTSSVTARIQTTVRAFLQDVAAYRTYLVHPALHLPATTNAVESMCRLVREMLRRNRAGLNPQALLQWATALIRLRPLIRCNSHRINRNV